MDEEVKNVEPWERQPEETPKAYAAFCIYRDLGLERSLSKAAAALGKTRGLLEDWSAKNDWVKRCELWDAEQDREARKAHLEEIKEMRKRHAELACIGLEKATAAILSKDPDDMSFADIARLAESLTKIERLSRGDVGDVIEERDGGEAINPVQIYIPDNNRGRDKQNYDDLEV